MTDVSAHMTELRETQIRLEHQKSLTDTLNKMAVILLSANESFDKTLDAGIRLIADALELDDLSVYRMQDGGSTFSQTYCWSKERGGLINTDPTLVNLPYAEYAPLWTKTLAEGSPVNSTVSTMPVREESIMRSFGILSAFIAPIFIDDEYWGFVFFEDKRRERVFDHDSSEMLLSAAFLLSSAIIKHELRSAIAEHNAYNDTLYNSIPIGFSVFDDDLELMDCNDTLMNMFGTNKAHYVNHFSETFPEYQPDGAKSLDAIRERMRRALCGQRQVFEFLRRSVTGELITCEITLSRIKHRGKYIGIGYVYDLRRIKSMMEAIREQGEVLNVRLEQQALMTDISKSFVLPGQNIDTLLQESLGKLGRYYSADQMLIHTLDHEQRRNPLTSSWTRDGWELRHKDFNVYDMCLHSYPRVLSEKDAISALTLPDLEVISPPVCKELRSIGVVQLISAPLYVNGNLWGMVSAELYSDTRKWTRHERVFMSLASNTIASVILRGIYDKQLTEALEKAVSASRFKSDFLSSMSHEIRTPLNAITGMTAIGKNAPDREKMLYCFSRIEEASTHLLGVICDILDMSKIETGKFELTHAAFNFKKTLQKITSMMSFSAHGKSKDISLDIDESIPEVLLGDEHRLAQVLTNIIGNSVKFTPEDGWVSVAARFRGEDLGFCVIEITVTDTGIGIAKELQGSLFQPFVQADSGDVRKYSGTGLGLSIAKNLVEMMGGQIWVDSEVGKGSTFTFTVRLELGEGVPLEDVETTVAPSVVSRKFPGKKLLLVEDIEINREIVVTMLKPMLLEIECVDNGQAALALFSASPESYDLILMDLQMPVMDGYEATRRLRALESPAAKTVPIIAMTANVFVESVKKCIEAGMNDHIGKPLKLDALMQMISEYLSKPRS